MQTFFQILMVLVFVLALVICPIAWLRMVRAQTRIVYWRNMATFVGLILAVFLIAPLAGMDTGIRELPTVAPTTPSFESLFGKWSPMQKTLLLAAAVLWIGGGNVLSYLHRKRLGKRWWQMLNPLEPPFKDFNGRESLALVVLAVASLVLGGAAIAMGQAP